MSVHSKKRGNVPRLPHLTPESVRRALAQSAKGAEELLRSLSADVWRSWQYQNLVLD